MGYLLYTEPIVFSDGAGSIAAYLSNEFQEEKQSQTALEACRAAKMLVFARGFHTLDQVG